MKVRSITAAGFIGADLLEVELPERGVVLVSGLNGAGKTTLPQAVAYACWGKLLRGPRGAIWTGEGDHQIVIEMHDQLTIKRGQRTLDWGRGDDVQKWPTPTKALEGLALELPLSFEAWRRACVVSSTGTAAFSGDADAARKRLLEALVGLRGFDDALTSCRTDERAVETALRTAAMKHAKAEGAEVTANTATKRAAEELANLPDVGAGTGQDTAQLHRMIDDARNEVDAMRATLQTQQRKLGELDAWAADARRQRDAVGVGACPVCAQPIPDNLRDNLFDAAVDTSNAAHAYKADSENITTVLRDDIQEINQDIDALRQRAADIDRAEQRAALTMENRARWEAALGQARAAATEAIALVDTASALVRESSRELATLLAVDHVLGLTGVRANLLDDAVHAVGEAASRYLELLPGGRIRGLHISSQATRKSGEVADVVSLELVDDKGNRRPYETASGGEARRVDVALMLALSDLACASAGAEGATLWADEVFDALDPVGMQGVSALLAEMSRDRCIVVITHSPDVVSMVEPVLHIRIDAGRVVQ